MRFLIPLVLLAPALVAVAADLKETKSALESDPAGWTDLFGKGLEGWKRVAIPAGSKLSDEDPWKYDAATGVLTCDGVGVHEMLLHQKEQGDGIFHVEWRFQKAEKTGYNSGVYVRNAADGSIWHQAQVGSKNVGYLFGNTLVEGKPTRIRADDKAPQRGREAGEWNTFEITCKGKTISLWVNGAVTTVWSSCEITRGLLGLEAEGYVIEFRNAKFKAGP